MHPALLTTGTAARLLGVSRQHVVNLCERGLLTHVRVGAHRRIPADEISRLLNQEPTREQEKALWLHRALMGKLALDPGRVLAKGRENIARWRPQHREDGVAVRYLNQWEQLIDEGVDAVAEMMALRTEAADELRQNSPFSGILSSEERRQALETFREHWAKTHPQPTNGKR